MGTNFELFRVTAKDEPVEVLEFKDQVHAFAWEPNGCRFVVLHGEPPRIDVSFYTMGAEADKKVGVPLQCEKITTLEKKGVNEVRWSPRGNSLLLAGLRNLNGYLEWWNVDQMEMVQQDEHFMATDIDWDPTGRFVVTSVGAWRHTMENGYVVWSVLGKKIHTVQKTQFWQFMWRPRPKSLLTKEEDKSILTDWKTWQARLMGEFEVQAAKWKSRHKQMAEMRYELRGYTSDEEAECVDVIETEETLLCRRS